MKISLFLADKLVEFNLPSQISGSFSFDYNPDEESKLINIESKNGKWILYGTTDVQIIQNGIGIRNVELVKDNFYTLNRNDVTYIIYKFSY